eukprot:TRINITY_DN2314_c0_g1_i1.p1 TRINITY_DN2314_c0_g1~~TRINITY_DN2314_c0_g1_i1.p1  ORF type:complete len:379 (+),score=87.90 TRINITY_DN2314_c0_g1_i1:505-1641(+)
MLSLAKAILSHDVPHCKMEAESVKVTRRRLQAADDLSEQVLQFNRSCMKAHKPEKFLTTWFLVNNLLRPYNPELFLPIFGTLDMATESDIRRHNVHTADVENLRHKLHTVHQEAVQNLQELASVKPALPLSANITRREVGTTAEYTCADIIGRAYYVQLTREAKLHMLYSGAADDFPFWMYLLLSTYNAHRESVHWSVPPNVVKALGVTHELCASPLNFVGDGITYTSPYPELDLYFGSLGDYRQLKKSGLDKDCFVLVNPLYIREFLLAVTIFTIDLCNDNSHHAVTCMMCLPPWEDEAYYALIEASGLLTLKISKSEMSTRLFVVESTCEGEGVKEAELPNGLMVILQNEKARHTVTLDKQTVMQAWGKLANATVW